jgi:hypothetical protein
LPFHFLFECHAIEALSLETLSPVPALSQQADEPSKLH